MLKLNKAEKVVLIGGIIVILAIVALGFAKKTLVDNKKEPFKVPESAETSSTTDSSQNEEPTDSGIKGITLKKAKFEVEVNKKLSEKVSTYVEASDDILKDITIDFSSVDTSKIGSYKAKLTYKKDQIDLPIVVKDSSAPIITVANAEVIFTIEATSTVDELINFVGATVEDNYDGVIGADQVKGWPSALSTKNETVTYTLKVKDSSGNEGTKDIKVKYIVPNDATTPSVE